MHSSRSQWKCKARKNKTLYLGYSNSTWQNRQVQRQQFSSAALFWKLTQSSRKNYKHLWTRPTVQQQADIYSSQVRPTWDRKWRRWPWERKRFLKSSCRHVTRVPSTASRYSELRKTRTKGNTRSFVTEKRRYTHRCRAVHTQTDRQLPKPVASRTARTGRNLPSLRQGGTHWPAPGPAPTRSDPGAAATGAGFPSGE